MAIGYTDILDEIFKIATKSQRGDIQNEIVRIRKIHPSTNQTEPLLQLLEKLVTTKERNKKYLSLPNARKRHRENQKYVEDLLQSVTDGTTTKESAIDDLFHIYKAQKQHLFDNGRRSHLNKYSISLLVEVEKLKRSANNFHSPGPAHTLSIPSVARKRVLHGQEDDSHQALLRKATSLLSNIHTTDENELQARILMAKTLIQTLQIKLPENCTEEHQQLINEAQSSTIETLLALSPSEIFQGNANENTPVFGIFDNKSSNLRRLLNAI